MKLFSSKDTVPAPAIITPWSLIHYCAGAASRKYMHFWTGQTMHIIYEFIGSKKIFTAAGFEVKEKSSVMNSFGDHFSFSAGQFPIVKNAPWGLMTVALFAWFTYKKVEF